MVNKTNLYFPYKKKNLYFENHNKFLKQLREYKPKMIEQNKINKLNIKFIKSPFEYLTKDNFLFKLENKYVVFEDSWNKYKHINEITDYFSEICRMQCVFYNEKYSPYNYFYYNYDQLIKKIIKKNTKNKKSTMNKRILKEERIHSIKNSSLKNVIKKSEEIIITGKELREELYNSIKECTLFNITVVINILKYFKVKKWLDFSAGWGDRLIGAIASNIELYVGIDPSECMKTVYPKIIDSLTTKEDINKYIIINKPYEDAILPEVDDFDLVFTSPPFFDLEIYNNNKSQSINRYKTFNEWMNNFMLYSIKKSWERLKKGGHMLLYIPDIYNGKVIGPTINDYITQTLKGIKLGKIYLYYTDNRKIKGIYVWKK